MLGGNNPRNFRLSQNLPVIFLFRLSACVMYSNNVDYFRLFMTLYTITKGNP